MRKARRWTQEVLAEEAGISVGVVKKLEQGGSARLSNVERIFETFGDASELFRAPRRSPKFDVEFVFREVELDFVTPDASRVRQTRQARVRARVPRVHSYVDHMSADGQIESLDVRPGTFEPMRTEGGDLFLRMMLVRPLNEGDETTVSMGFNLVDSFSHPTEEYWSLRVNHPTELTRLVVRFHPERPYRTYCGFERFTTHETVCDVQPTAANADGKPSLIWEIPQPGVGCIYKLRWSW